MIKVLVVEDDDDVRELWRRALQTGGHEVVEATTVDAALTALDTDGPDILILDWRVGKATTSLVLDQWVKAGDGPAMVISGDVNLPTDKLYLGGAWHVLPKPVELGVFLTIVHRYGRVVKLEQAVEEYRVSLARLKRAVFVLAIISLLNVANVPQVVEWLRPILGLL